MPRQTTIAQTQRNLRVGKRERVHAHTHTGHDVYGSSRR